GAAPVNFRRWLASCRCAPPPLPGVIRVAPPVAVPPLQHPQCPEGVPAAGRAPSFQLEVGLALVAVVERPAAVVAPRPSDDVDRLGEARIARRLDGLEVIERAQDVVVPARREGKAEGERLGCPT